MILRRPRLLSLALGGCLLLAHCAAASPSAVSRPAAEVGDRVEERASVRLPYTSTGSVNSVVWVAADAGFFARNGLDVDLSYVESATTALQALVSGGVDVVQGGGSAAVHGALSGADTVILATMANTLPYKVMVDPAIDQPADLRGKRIGVSRYGTSSDLAARLLLEHFGLQPEQDAAILQIGGQTARLGALRQGGIDAGMFDAPYNVVIAREGFRELLDTADLQIPYIQSSIFTTRAYVEAHEPATRGLMRAVVQAIAYMKQDPVATKQILAKYTQETDPAALDEAYADFVTRLLPRAPYPVIDGVRGVLKELALTQPDVGDLDPAGFVDDRFVRELDTSGYIASLYR